MSLYDEMEEISSRQQKTAESGGERIYGVILAVVVENYKKELPGMVQVQIPVREEENSIYRWAKVAHMYSGKEWGQYFQPEIGDQVLLAFEHGNIERPFIVGSVPRNNDRFISQSAREQNETKRIVSRHGNEIAILDVKDSDGEKDKIQIQTNGKAQSISLENEKRQIVVRAEDKLTIKVGDTITVTLNGSSGKVTIEAKQVHIHASDSMRHETDGSAALSGRNTTISASAALKLESNGMAAVKGSTISLG
ncbi:phage baseplate assembly protein V [Dorea sp. D27]|uniref:phage baseplate assembly protein V n=1 Tax=Dorea sp. D27 TaxID=658665 RepID=UPI00067315DA|nr:phage baseplate assembly protein V [Dorea sp. D27]KMZ53595.1 hypothetical protein HMPREF0980_02464 [Dorea sp. D27]